MVRRFFASICFVLGVISLVAWGITALVVNTVEEGTVVTGVAKKLIEQPAVAKVITEKAQLIVNTQISETGVDLGSLGLQGTMDDVVASAVASDTFQQGLMGAVDDARADFADQLTSADSAGQPFILRIDISASINQTISGTPVLGDVIPQLTLGPIEVPIASSETFEKVRGTYSWIHTIATWAGWIALLLIGAGIALTPRKRWLIPLGLLWAGLGSGAVWVMLHWFTLERIAEGLPGGSDGDLGSAVLSFAKQESLDRFAYRVLLVAFACLASAVITYLVVKIATGSSKGKDGEDHHRGIHEPHTPEHAR